MWRSLHLGLLTSDAQLGLGVQQRLLHLLRLRDVHLQEGEVGRAASL